MKIVIVLALLMGTSCFRSGCRPLIVVLLLAIYGGSGVFAEIRRPKNVQVAVQAKWSGTSILLEAGYSCFSSPFPVLYSLICSYFNGVLISNSCRRKLSYVDEVLLHLLFMFQLLAIFGFVV